VHSALLRRVTPKKSAIAHRGVTFGVALLTECWSLAGEVGSGRWLVRSLMIQARDPVLTLTVELPDQRYLYPHAPGFRLPPGYGSGG
jgi:hypothetical protein